MKASVVASLVLVAGVISAGATKAVLLDASNFDSVVTPDKTCLCMFYATWCPYCQRFHNAYDEIADQLQGSVTVCKVDVDNCGTLTNRFSIDMYPKICLLKAGDHDHPEYYGGQRDVGAVVQWARSRSAVYLH